MRFLRQNDRRAHPGPDGRSAAWPFALAADHPCFDGHFDDGAILPGIAHLAVALEACRLLMPTPNALVKLRDVRFTRPLLPGDECEVAVTPTADGRSMRFEIRCGGESASQGILVFSAEGSSGRDA